MYVCMYIIFKEGKPIYRSINLEVTHTPYTWLLTLSALPGQGIISVYHVLNQTVSTIRNNYHPISSRLVNNNMETGMTLSN